MPKWDHFFGGAPAQSGRREASTWIFFDRLDIFSNATNQKITLALLLDCESATIDQFGASTEIFVQGISFSNTLYKVGSKELREIGCSFWTLLLRGFATGI